VAAGNGEFFEEAQSQALWASSFWESIPTLNILDLGCGIGRHAVHWASAGAKVWGIDSSPNLVSIARQYSGCVQIQAENLLDDPWPCTTFDLIVCLSETYGTGPTWVSWSHALTKAHNALATDGLLILELASDQSARDTYKINWRTDHIPNHLEVTEFGKPLGGSSRVRHFSATTASAQYEFTALQELYSPTQFPAFLRKFGFACRQLIADESEGSRFLVVASPDFQRSTDRRY
jgi:SAM-dependent methyltransferase